MPDNYNDHDPDIYEPDHYNKKRKKKRRRKKKNDDRPGFFFFLVDTLATIIGLALIALIIVEVLMLID